MKSSNSGPIEIIGEQTQDLIERSAKMWKVDTLYYNLPIASRFTHYVPV